MCIASQEECVSDAHRVVDVQIKLQITEDVKNSMLSVQSVFISYISPFFLVLPSFLSEPEDWHSGSYQLGVLYIHCEQSK